MVKSVIKDEVEKWTWLLADETLIKNSNKERKLKFPRIFCFARGSRTLKPIDAARERVRIKANLERAPGVYFGGRPARCDNAEKRTE